MIYLYTILFHQPLLNLLVFFYNTIAFHDLGLSIIFLTILVRLILFPIFQKSVRTQTVMQYLQPKIKKIQEDHKHDLKKQSETMMELYREHRVNPFSGFFLLIIQLPILIALYRVFMQPLSAEVFSQLYTFIPAPGELGHSLLGLINLNEKSMVIVGLAVIAQYIQGQLSIRKTKNEGKLDAAQRMTRNMIFISPVITLIFLMYLPAAVGLYWLTTTLFTIFQQSIVNKQLANGKLGNVYQNNNRADGV